MPPRPPAWLDPSPPWLRPVPDELRASLPLPPDTVPVVELLSAPCTLSEVVALRAGRYVPLFGLGATRAEQVRALALLARAFGEGADPRAPSHATSFLSHPALGPEPLRALAAAVVAGECDPAAGALALGIPGVLGTRDAVRELVAAALADVTTLTREVTLARAVGGDGGRFREHYQLLCALDGLAIREAAVARAWFDFVLARRWAGLDALKALAAEGRLDAPSQWLVASAEWLAGEELARGRVAEHAQTALAPVQPWLPRLAVQVARELVELLAKPWALRWAHLRCAAARDHAAAAIRHWLHAANEAEPDDAAPEALGPEPSRAGRDAVAARQRAGEFLLDWFVHEREAASAVDAWATSALRIYHRLRGATLVAGAERALRPGARPSQGLEQLVWGGTAS